jgi:hypothetical protein
MKYPQNSRSSVARMERLRPADAGSLLYQSVSENLFITISSGRTADPTVRHQIANCIVPIWRLRGRMTFEEHGLIVLPCKTRRAAPYRAIASSKFIAKLQQKSAGVACMLCPSHGGFHSVCQTSPLAWFDAEAGQASRHHDRPTIRFPNAIVRQRDVSPLHGRWVERELFGLKCDRKTEQER